MPLKIVCVNAGNYLGRGVEYVKILENMISRNLPVGTEYQFICFTDDLTPIDGVQFRPLHGGLTGWWNKLWLFKNGLWNVGDRIVYFDLDTVITGDLTDIINYSGDFAILRDFYRPHGLGSGVMAWSGGWGAHLWREYEKAGFPDMQGGDQAWIESHVLRPDILQDLFPSQIVSYKVSARSHIPDKAKIVAFHGEPRPHQCEGWVRLFWKLGGYSTLDPIVGNSEEDQLVKNIEYSTKLDRQWLENHAPEHKGHAVIVGGGPSLWGDLEEIKWRATQGQTIFALNNSWKWLLDNKINPDIHVMLDARPENAKFVPNVKMSKYYASQCDKEVWDAAPDAILWNHLNALHIVENDPRAQTYLAGGSTVGLNAMVLAYILGYREIHLYGFDSSYDDERHHAYNQTLNDKERVITVIATGKEFSTAAWMAQQVNEFCILTPQLLSLGCTITVHGRGLLPHVAKNIGDFIEVPKEEQRACAILERIKDTQNPVGAEVGVFTGQLSKRLLGRDDLTLYMVDSWKEHDKESEYTKSGDYHGQLSQTYQDNLYQYTKDVVSFAGERAKVVRKDSLIAAADFEDESLDFVFLDADHTYSAIKADLAAWMPKVKSGGWLGGHDYDHPNFPSWGVKQAVDEMELSVELDADFTWFTKIE